MKLVQDFYSPRRPSIDIDNSYPNLSMLLGPQYNDMSFHQRWHKSRKINVKSGRSNTNLILLHKTIDFGSNLDTAATIPNRRIVEIHWVLLSRTRYIQDANKRSPVQLWNL